MAMRCTSCGIGLPQNAKFCAECGAPVVARACPACGVPAEHGRFCMECGTPIDGDPTAHVRVAESAGVQHPVAERRVTSVLFGDLVGFTTLSESRDSEDVRELLTKYFDLCRTVIGRYGGTVEKFIGDAVMAVWGVPTAHEDDAERAVRAGLEIVESIAAMGADLQAPDLAMRAGVVTGEVAVTIGATSQGMVAGDAVNTASRVQSAATPGRVWVDETTRSLSSAAISFTDVGQHSLKGKSEPMQLWQAGSGRRGGRWAASHGRSGGPADRPGAGAAADQGALPRCRGVRPPPARGRRRRAGRGQVPAGLGVREVQRRVVGIQLVAPWPLPRLRRRCRVLGPRRGSPHATRPP